MGRVNECNRLISSTSTNIHCGRQHVLKKKTGTARCFLPGSGKEVQYQLYQTYSIVVLFHTNGAESRWPVLLLSMKII